MNAGTSTLHAVNVCRNFNLLTQTLLPLLGASSFAIGGGTCGNRFWRARPRLRLPAARSLTRSKVPRSRAPRSRSRRNAARTGARVDARIAALHAGLKLTADQEKNWPALEAALRDLNKQRQERLAARANADQPRDPVERLSTIPDVM